MVTRGAKQVVWLLTAFAALAAQAVPSAFCRSCDLPCCGVAGSAIDVAVGEPGDEPTGACPLCAATAARADRSPAEQSEQPCRCQLEARDEQPILRPEGCVPRAGLAAHAALTTAVDLGLPKGLGVSREYLAASLAVPIRPARILFGVWRD